MDLIFKNKSTLYVTQEGERTYRLPCNTSRAELGGAPSTVRRDLFNKSQPQMDQNSGYLHFLLKYLNRFLAGWAGTRTYPRTWWPLAAVWPGGGEAASRRPLQLRAPGRQGDSLHLGAAALRRRLEAPARPLLEQTKFHLRWPRKAHTTLIKFPLWKLQLQKQTPVEPGKFIGHLRRWL